MVCSVREAKCKKITFGGGGGPLVSSGQCTKMNKKYEQKGANDPLLAATDNILAN